MAYKPKLNGTKYREYRDEVVMELAASNTLLGQLTQQVEQCSATDGEKVASLLLINQLQQRVTTGLTKLSLLDQLIRDAADTE